MREMEEQMLLFGLEVLEALTNKAAEQAKEDNTSFKKFAEDNNIWGEVEELSEMLNELPDGDSKLRVSERLEDLIETIEEHIKD